MATFVNLSNHPSSRWNPQQLAAAQALGCVVDIAFPAIDPAATTEEIVTAATQLLEQLQVLDAPVVMVQGEYTFTYQLVRLLEASGIQAVAACSRRITHEETDETGATVKTSEFIFEGFRDYYLPKKM